MKDKKGSIAILMVSILLGLILAIQYKTVNKSVGNGVLPTQRAQQLSIDLKKAEDEKELLIKELDEVESKLKLYEQNKVDKDIYTENIYNDLEKYRMLAGYIDLEGPGISIEINDPDSDLQFGSEQSIVDDLDLVLQIISVLNAAEAEAISINGQRYTSFTEIERAGEHIEINGVSVASPIFISAIGDPDTLESALALKRGIVWTLEYYNYNVNLKKEELVEIPKYRKIKEFIYSKPIESDEA